MKMLANRTPIATGLPFDLEAIKLHCRVADDSEDQAIETIGLTAAAELEQFAQIALLTQTVRINVFHAVIANGMTLPIGPASQENSPIVTIDGEPFSAFEFLGGMRPYIRWHSEFLDLNAERISIEYQAGFGASASDVPADLAQALMDQAALHYDGRSPMDAKSLTTSPHMARVGARYRGVQL